MTRGRSGFGQPLGIIALLLGMALLTTLIVDTSNRRSRSTMHHAFAMERASNLARAAVEEAIFSEAGQAVLLDRITASLPGRPNLTEYPKTLAYFVGLLDPMREDALTYQEGEQNATEANQLTHHLRLVAGPPNTVEFFGLPAGEVMPTMLVQSLTREIADGSVDITEVEILPLLYVQREEMRFDGGIQGAGVVRATGIVQCHGQRRKVRRRFVGEYVFDLFLDTTSSPPTWRAMPRAFPWRTESTDET